MTEIPKNPSEDYCEKHDRNKNQTGGMTFVCPECELEHFESGEGNMKVLEDGIVLLAHEFDDLKERAAELQDPETIPDEYKEHW